MRKMSLRAQARIPSYTARKLSEEDFLTGTLILKVALSII
jgi:hypothetical protein